MIDYEILSCPLTGLILSDPVDTHDGHTFEREAIEKWLEQSSISPVTGRPLENKTIRPNQALKKVINDYILKNEYLIEKNQVYLIKNVKIALVDDIINKNIELIKSKLQNFIDYRYFTVDLEFNNTQGYSAFYLACEYGSQELTAEIFNYLFRNKLVDKLADKPAEWRPYFLKDYLRELFCQEEAHDAKKKLTELILKFDADIQKLDPYYLIDLCHISAKHSSIIIRWLVTIGKVTVNSQDQAGNNLILIAALNNNQSLFEFLLQVGADVNSSNKNKENCFYFAIKNKSIAILKLILDKLRIYKSKSQIKSIEFLPMHLALEYYSKDLNLFDRIIDINESYLNMRDKNDQTPLMFACELENMEAVDYFLRKEGVLINHVDFKQENCLHIAVRNKNKALIELLLLNGVNLYQKNTNDQTPVDLADRMIKKFLKFKREEIFTSLQQSTLELKKDNLELQKRLQYLNTLNSLNCANKFIACGCSDGSIDIWNIDNEQCVKTLEGHGDKVWDLELMDNGSLISCSSDETIKIWNLESGKCVHSIKDENNIIYRIKLLADNILVSSSQDNSIKIWDLEAGVVKKKLYGHKDSVECFISISNNHLVSGSNDKTIKIWNLSSRVCLKTLVGHSDGICFLELITEKSLISGSKDFELRIWDLDSDYCIKTLILEIEPRIGLNKYFFNDPILVNDDLIVCCCDKNILIFSLEDGKLVRTLQEHTSGILRLKLVENEKLISGSINGVIKVWNVNTGKCLATFQKSLSSILSFKLISNLESAKVLA